MAERLYLGPVSKQLRGNREDALALEREARAKVGYLFDSMAPGQTFKSGSWASGGGRKITAFVWNDLTGKRATIRLVGIGGKEEQALQFYMDSGILYGTREQFRIEGVRLIPNTSIADWASGTIRYNVCGSVEADNSEESKYWGPDISDDVANGDEDPRKPPDLYPQISTGLGKLWAQGMVGCGRSVDKIIPEADDSSYRRRYRRAENILDGMNDGRYPSLPLASNPDGGRVSATLTVIRSPTGQYWLVNYDFVSMSAMLLELEWPFSELNACLLSGGFSDQPDLARTLMALVLGNLQRSKQEVPTTLITQDTMLPYWRPEVYKQRLPIAGDMWTWSEQQLGDPDEGAPQAVIVLYPRRQSYQEELSAFKLVYTPKWGDDGKLLGETVGDSSGDFGLVIEEIPTDYTRDMQYGDSSRQPSVANVIDGEIGQTPPDYFTDTDNFYPIANTYRSAITVPTADIVHKPYVTEGTRLWFRYNKGVLEEYLVPLTMWPADYAPLYVTSVRVFGVGLATPIFHYTKPNDASTYNAGWNFYVSYGAVFSKEPIEFEVQTNRLKYKTRVYTPAMPEGRVIDDGNYSLLLEYWAAFSFDRSYGGVELIRLHYRYPLLPDASVVPGGVYYFGAPDGVTLTDDEIEGLSFRLVAEYQPTGNQYLYSEQATFFSGGI